MVNFLCFVCSIVPAARIILAIDILQYVPLKYAVPATLATSDSNSESPVTGRYVTGHAGI